MTSPRQQPRPLLQFTCPTTGRAVPTGIASDAESLRKAWKKKLNIECPRCGEPHEILIRKAFIERAVQNAAELD
jgi:peptide subunit release factor 1 (eRF1)